MFVRPRYEADGEPVDEMCWRGATKCVACTTSTWEIVNTFWSTKNGWDFLFPEESFRFIFLYKIDVLSIYLSICYFQLSKKCELKLSPEKPTNQPSYSNMKELILISRLFHRWSSRQCKCLSTFRKFLFIQRIPVSISTFCMQPSCHPQNFAPDYLSCLYFVGQTMPWIEEVIVPECLIAFY